MSKIIRFFKKLFKKKKKSPTTQEAIESIREAEKLLAKKQEYLEIKINDQLDLANKYANKNKKR
jgi:hypothetical protein